MEMASYRCEYHGPSGTRCTARAGLEIDHIEPYARGGSNRSQNLRVLCRRHNLLAAKKAYGEEFIRTRIEERLQASGVVASTTEQTTARFFV
jgi:5-methylcytosine-specific restriction endonuclease McrA